MPANSSETCESTSVELAEADRRLALSGARSRWCKVGWGWAAVEYRVKAVALSALRLREQMHFALPGAMVDITNWDAEDMAGKFHKGLFFDVVLEAESTDRARVLASRVLEQIEAALSFAMAVAIGHSQPIATFEASTVGVSVEQTQVLPVVAGARRWMVHDRFRTFWEPLQLVDPIKRNRLERAIAWHRKGSQEEYTLDRFVSWMSGLEALNPLIQEKYGLTRDQTRPCPNCDQPVNAGPIATGMARALESAAGADFARQVRRARNDIVHARESIGPVVEQVNGVLGDVGRALREAVLDLLDVPVDQRGQFIATNMEIPRQYRERVDFVTPDVRYADLPLGQIFPSLPPPRIDARREETQAGMTERVSTFYEDLPFRAKLVAHQIEVRVDPDDPLTDMRHEDPTVTPRRHDNGTRARRLRRWLTDRLPFAIVPRSRVR